MQRKWAELVKTLNRPFIFYYSKRTVVFSSHLWQMVRSRPFWWVLEPELKENVHLGFKSEWQSLSWVLLRGLTLLNEQLDVDLVVIEPARDLHPAAVLPTITPPSVQDGEGHVSVSHPAQQLVPGRLQEQHGPVRRENGAGTFGAGHFRPSPTEWQGAVSLGVVPAGQRHVVPIPASD